MRSVHDVVIVGCGIAGLTCAIRCREAGRSVLVLTKTDVPEDTNTNLAQGGIIAWKEGQQSSLLEQDIRAAGCDYNDPETVARFSREAPHRVFEFLIDHAGVQFSPGTDGGLDYTEEAAHSERRILHYEDHTGDTIQRALLNLALQSGVELRSGWTAVDLITNDHHSRDPRELYRPREVLGLYVLENSTGQVHTVFTDAVVLATGGIGNIYKFTTNPPAATGDGLAMAHRAGADIINCEFMQFHPTSLFHKDIKRFLISESLRGEGAKLVDRTGQPFMERYSSQGDLAPRDVVSRGIFEEMARQGVEYLMLDLAGNYRGTEPIEKRFSRIYTTCMKGGIDITRQAIPIVPAAHYFCGGIKVDATARTSLRRLYAAGETSCSGLHGANRLASTSLLEGLHQGWDAAADICTASGGVSPQELAARRAEIPDWEFPRQAEQFELPLIYQDWNMIKLTMWNQAGIVRTRRGLERAQADLNYHAHRITKFYREAELNRDIIELRNGVAVAQLVVSAAFHNQRSVGCHYRKD